MKIDAKPFEGKWYIQEMDVWSKDSINMLGRANITFDDGEMGSFRFIAVVGFTDCRFSTRDGQPFTEFSWQGRDERDDACGRGWATIEEDGKMFGHIFIHCGEDSAFAAIRA